MKFLKENRRSYKMLIHAMRLMDYCTFPNHLYVLFIQYFKTSLKLLYIFKYY